MIIDRQYQKRLLSFLLNEYPSYENTANFCQTLREEDDEKYLGNVIYLQRHGLLEDGASVRFSSSGQALFGASAFPRITEKGIDFMLQDGGLGAVLNVQTVKIHPDTIKQLLEAKIMASSVPENEKTNLIGKLRDLPHDAANRLLDKLLDKAVDSIPAILTSML